ncbi:MAG: sigma-70 family RNA polymerase sigma factor [Victivallaceae bacterium]|jgi:RNA polymerase sigma-70 factor (ECF subfamily)
MSPEEALKNLMEENESALLGFAGRMLRDASTAQDAVQMAFIKYNRQTYTGGEIRNPRAWLFKTVRNDCLNLLRAKKIKAEITIDDGGNFTAHHDRPDQGIMNHEKNQLLTAAINGLKPRAREILVLKLEHGKSYREIAEIMDLSVGNVGFILHSAVNELKNHITKELSI